ncbi:unnamed protein product [Ixodes hexagonus]
MRLSKYGASLSGPEKERYLFKVRRCDGVDPLVWKEHEMVQDASAFPKVQFTNIKDYLVHATSFLSRDQLKAYKSLEAHNYLTSGWVQEPFVKVLSEGVLVVGKVRPHNPSSIRDALLRPWPLLKPDGEVQMAHCTCMAGLGEACSHVGAVLFFMEAVVRRRNDQACTDQENAWLPPHVQVVDCIPVAKMDFSSSEMKRKLDGEQPRTPVTINKSIDKVADEEWSTFLASCHQAGSRPALLALNEDYAHEFVPVATKFPSAVLSNLLRHDPTPAWEELVEQCTEVADSLSIEPQVAALVQEQTTEQPASTKRFSFRAGQITASNAKTVCRTSISQPSQSLLKRICYPMEVQFWSPAVAWGRANETKAKQAYEAKAKQAYEAKAIRLHKDFLCKRSGLHISSKHPFLGASPDGLVDCSCCGPGVLEVKCPYTFRNNFVKEMPGKKYSCLSKEGDDLVLQEDHIYYYQIQTQMLVCDKTYCDFVVWTTKDFVDLRIERDERLCKETVASCGKYFKSVLLPELLYKYWSTKHAEAISQFAEPTATKKVNLRACTAIVTDPNRGTWCSVMEYYADISGFTLDA